MKTKSRWGRSAVRVRLPTLLERSCDPRRSKAWSEAGGLHQLYIYSGVTLTSLGEMICVALTSLGLFASN